MGSPITTPEATSWDFELTGDGRPLWSSLRQIPRYWDLVVLFTYRDLVAVFKQTVLGPLWIVIQPLLTTAVYAVVFGGIAGLSTSGVPDLLFYLLGVTFWGLFASTFGASANLFVANEHIFSKVYFPRLVSMLSGLLSKMVIFAIQLAIFALVSVIAYRDVLADRINAAVFLAPLALVTISMLATGLGLLIAASTVRYRDFRKLVSFGTQLMLYATPVIYSVEDVPSRILSVLRWNPLTPIFESLRWGFFDAQPVEFADLAYSTAVSIATLALGVAAFHRVEQSFVDEI